jgi:hypothetical protein
MLASSTALLNETQPWLEPALGANLSPLALQAPDDPSGSPFSYTFVEVGARQLDVDQVDVDVDSYYARGSLALLDFVHVFAEYENQEFDVDDTDSDLITLGAGVHFNVIQNLDLVGEAGWLYSDATSDLSALDDTTTGYTIFGGARWMAMPWDGGGLELNGGIGYVDLKNRLASEDKAAAWEVGARMHFLGALSIGATYEVLEEDDALVGSVRFSL